MRSAVLLVAFAFAISTLFAASFSITPYLYSGEASAQVDVVSFAYGSQTAKIYKVGGLEALLTLDDKILGDKAQISAVLNDYYSKTYYPSAADLAALKDDADNFNKSRNYVTQYGPAEKTCRAGGTFLDYKPCNDLFTCTQTASLVCYVTGSEGCMVDVLASYILDYKQGIDSLDAAYAKFNSAYTSFGPSNTAYSLDQMDTAFSDMKTGADRVAQNKLRFPKGGASACRDCLGVCPEANFDYAAITAGKSKVAELKEKTMPYATLEGTVDSLAISTEERVKYRAGEEKALIFAPKLKVSQSKFGSLKADAVEAKALVSDSNFVAAADSFLNKNDELEQKLEARDFSGFDSLLSAYDSSGKALQAMINNSTAAYRKAADRQDDANDGIIEASWRVNRLSQPSISSYNSLATRKNKLDEGFKPPMPSSQYIALSDNYAKLADDAKAYIQASTSVQDSIFTLGNSFGKTSVDGAMALASSMTPVSFKTRQSMAKYVPPIALGIVDLSILAVGIIAFVGVFYYFHGFFRSKLAISGWVLSMLGFVFILLVGSVGFYSIVLSTEKFTSFSEFMDTIRSSDRVAIIVEAPSTAPSVGVAMGKCADQIEAQMKSQGKLSIKYYLTGGSCTTITPKMGANNTTVYETLNNIPGTSCLDTMPDLPVFDLQYSSENQAPTFTTVGAKQAIFKNNEEYYARTPSCAPADVLG